jgi:RHS repeat-associated protein
VPNVNCVLNVTPIASSSLPSSLSSAARSACLLMAAGLLFYFAHPAEAQIKPNKAQDVAAVTEPRLPVQEYLPPPPPTRYVPGLEEPLVAMGDVTEQENTDLGAALAAFRDTPSQTGQQGDYDDYAKPLLAFIAAHPGSNWNAALYADIGFGYYRAGYYSRTLTYLDKAWQLGRNATTPQARLMIDRAVGELARMHARVGHDKELEALFIDIGSRPISGSATELIQGAHEGLWDFRHRPEISFLCGPNALKNLLATLKATPEQIKVAEDARSGPGGFSLTQLAALADKAKLKYELIYREPGQPLPVQSIINWKVHHYAAITERQNGRYVVQDPTFGSGGIAVVTEKVIDAESSGYFLVPASVVAANPGSGWRIVAADSPEIRSVYGTGVTTNNLPDETMFCISCALNAIFQDSKIPSHGLTTANAMTMVVSLNLSDTSIGYQPQKGAAAFTTLAYNQREAVQPSSFTYFNVGPKWTLNWIKYVADDPNASNGLPITRTDGGGGGYSYTYNSSQNGSYPEQWAGVQLSRIPLTGPATSYQRLFPDGTVEVYTLSNGATVAPRLMFLTQIIDPAGNMTTLTYDSTFRLTHVTDAMGRKTVFSYGLAAAPLLVTKITDPFGRFSQLNYDTSYRLASITDAIGITSTFTYGSAAEPDLVTALTTPYGKSTFSDAVPTNDTGESNTRALTLTDPLGYTDFVYYYPNYSLIPCCNPPANDPGDLPPTGMPILNNYLQYRNMFYWNRHAFAYPGAITKNPDGSIATEDITKALLTHWEHDTYDINDTGMVPESIKAPLENRVWMHYPGSTAANIDGTYNRPDYVGRVLDDGTSQVSAATYNLNFTQSTVAGNQLSSTDAEGRTTLFAYASDNIDLATVQQLTAPSTYTTIATFSNYNSQHEPQTYTGADGQVWNYTYNVAGQLATVTDPRRGKTTYNYDSLGRLSTVQNANLVTVLTLTYDTADRVQTRTDSEGYQLTYAYDKLDRLTKISYPDGTTDLYNYNFQSGTFAGTPSLELRKHIDRLGRVTTYGYDADRRLTSVTESLETGVTRTTSYDYYEDGTLKDITDANGNVTHWEIDLESRPISKTYAFGTGEAEGEIYAYEDTTSRLKSLSDALAQVKSYTYGLDNRLTGITYTNAENTTPDVTFAFDPFFPRLTAMTDGTGTTNYTYTAIGTNGALKLASVNGPFGNDGMNLTYDALGRMSGRVIPGGNESFLYDPISRLTSHTTPLGVFSYGYLGQTDQTTSRSVTNGTTTVSTGWGYDTNVNDRRLISIANSGVTRSYALNYLNGGTINPYDIMGITDMAAHGHPWATQNHTYGYDLSDRLLSATATVPGNDTYVYDRLDNATTVTTPGITVNPTYNMLNQLATWGGDTYSYTLAGNTTSGDGTKSYKWDAENRMVEIDYVGSMAKSKFTYDGVSRRVIDAETAANGTVTTTRYLWCGSVICQSRNSSDTVLRRDLDEGELNVSTGQKLIYMPDQLGSVRDVLDGTTGGLVAASDYSPYGAIARTFGSTTTDYRYAGFFYHPPSTLSLSTTRPMDGVTGRWLARDPIREAGGINLYGYVDSNPIGLRDRRGLAGETLLYGTGNAVESGEIVAFCASPEGWIPCAGLAAYAMGKLCMAAWDEYRNNSTLVPPIPPPDSSRNSDRCKEEWEAAHDRCSDQMSLPPRQRIPGVWGGSYGKCLMGQVSQVCGGNRVVPGEAQ